MDKDAERHLNDHDDKTFQFKPLRTSTSRSRLTPNSLFGFDSDKKRVLSIERLHDRDSWSEGGEDAIINTSTESVEEDLKRPIYVTDPETGKKYVRLQFDFQGFESKDIKIKIAGRKLIIFATRRETDSSRRSTTEFCRKIKLPEDVDVERLQCSFVEGLLVAEAPVVRESYSIKHRLNVAKMEQLNMPLIRHTEMGRMMHMFVELGRIFKPDDVVVKLKGHDRLVINAQRQEVNPNDTLTASVTREFSLPEKIYPHSLKAGLTQDGILNVTAIVEEQSPVNTDKAETQSSVSV